MEVLNQSERIKKACDQAITGKKAWPPQGTTDSAKLDP